MQAKTISDLSRSWSACGGAGLEFGVGQRVDEGDEEFILVADGFDLVIGVEDFAFVQAQRFDDVLVGVGVDGFFKRLAQQVLAALGRGDVAIGAEHDVVGGERIGGDEEAEVALDQTALVFGERGGVFPLRDVAAHVHFLRHPVVGARIQVFLPRPFVFEGNELIHVRGAVDDALVGGPYALAFGCGGRIGHVGCPTGADVLAQEGRHVDGLGGGCEIFFKIEHRSKSPLVVPKWAGPTLLFNLKGLPPANEVSPDAKSHWPALPLFLVLLLLLQLLTIRRRPRTPASRSASYYLFTDTIRILQTRHPPAAWCRRAPSISGSGRLAAALLMADPPPDDTAFSSPPLPVDFSAEVAPRVRR